MPSLPEILGVDVGEHPILTDSDGNRVEMPCEFRNIYKEFLYVAGRIKGTGHSKRAHSARKCLRGLGKKAGGKLGENWGIELAEKYLQDGRILAVENFCPGTPRTRNIVLRFAVAAQRGFYRRLHEERTRSPWSALFVDPTDSSKICAYCGSFAERLDDRWFYCSCGRYDRHKNAALNMKLRGLLYIQEHQEEYWRYTE